MAPSERLYVRTFGFKIGDDWFDVAHCQPAIEPAAGFEPYDFIIDRGLSKIEPAFAIYRLLSGEVCCLLQQVHSGRQVRNMPVCHSFLFVNPSGVLGDRILHLADIYLDADDMYRGPIWSGWTSWSGMAVVVSPASAAAFHTLGELVEGPDGVVPATGDRIVAAPDGLGRSARRHWPSRSRAAAALLTPGTHQNHHATRQQLADALKGDVDVAPGELLTLVTYHPTADRLARLQCRWRLHPRPAAALAPGLDESTPPSPADIPPRVQADADGPAEPVTTALSMLTARVALLERRMLRVRHRDAFITCLVLTTLLISVLLLITR